MDWSPLTARKSLPDACEDVGENPRGKYSAMLAPCIFHFHQVPPEDENPNLSPFRLFTACADDNLVGGKEAGLHVNTVKEYVKMWPDDCVGDFQRCYSIAHDEKIFFRFVCGKGWVFPEDTTHMSVDCKADKARKLDNIEENELIGNTQSISASREQRRQQSVRFGFRGILLASLLP